MRNLKILLSLGV